MGTSTAFRQAHRIHSICRLVIVGLAIAGPPAAAATYYVRTDGGDASQCTGRANAAYPGSGTSQACAWKHPFFALSPSGTKRIAGGDTLLIGSGSYMMGAGAPGASSCSGTSCYLPPIPSGTSTARTRILGQSCSAPPKLWGTGGASRVLNLNGSSNVEVGCLDVSDHHDCVYGHSKSTAACTSGSTWARVGLYARASSNVWLHDLNIHGLAQMGMNAGGLNNWTMDRVRINANGRAGWDANVGSGSSNSGAIVLRNVEIAWNGCGERWQTGEPWACWAQQTGGYGDGLGTIDTGGQWLVEDTFVHHNTSDGLDFRYMDGADTTKVTLRRVHAVANAGNQVKVKGNSLIENSVLVSQCGYFKGKYYMIDGDHCRAGGNTLQLVFTSRDVATVRHNTITGEGGVLVGGTEGDSSNKVYLQNNVFVGFPAFLKTGVLSALYYANNTSAAVSYSGNLVWNVKNSVCPSGSICGQNPKLTNMTLAGFDAEPLAGSPVIDKAPMISAVTTDFVLQRRPSGVASDIGAYEVLQGTVSPSPTPTCTRAAPTMTLSGPTSAVAAGTRNTYTVALRNNDSSTCSNTSFALARTIPTGWTGTLSTSSVALAPGASGSATLAVTSPATATAGSYGIGAGVSSGVGSVHTRNASATYSVATPVATCTRNPATVSISGPTAAVAAGSTVKYTVSVRNNDGSCYNGKTFSLASTVPAGWTGAFAQSSSYITSGSTFSTTLSVKSAGTAAGGTYRIGVGTSTSYAIHTASASTTYAVASTAGLSETLSTSKSVYVAGERVYWTARVLKNGAAVSGASVRFDALKPNGINTIVLKATTDSNGYAHVSFISGTGPSSIGTYKLRADATSGTLTATASTTFAVQK